MKFETKTIHAGMFPDPSTGAIMTPIFQTSTYVQEAPGVHKGFEYARTQNPTRSQLEANLAALENAKYGRCFSSGMAATDSFAKTFEVGDEIIATDDLYGGTYRIFTQLFAKYGVTFKFIDLSDVANLKAHLSPKTKWVWVETPTNPMLKIVDLKLITEVAHANNSRVVVDNTFASPYLQNPLDQGADAVMHSVTKYLAGHSDVVMGFLGTNDKSLDEKFGFMQNSAGAVPGPQDCFLAIRGIKTLHVRMQRHCENASSIAHFLTKQSIVKDVFYPGLPQHPNHSIAKKQMRHFGGMVSFNLQKDTEEEATKVLTQLKVFSLAESLGGVESLAGYPAGMTHASIPKEQRIASGISDSLIRLSVGIEHIDDLIADLEQAL